MQRTQYKLVDNPGARLYQLGFTVTEIETRKEETHKCRPIAYW